jgi:hypothetical protein
MAAGDLDLVVAPVRETAIVYRIVRGADRSAPAVLDSLRSHYEWGAPPRGYERRLAVIHMGLSVFSTQAAARAMALKWPMIGTFIAELNLEPEHGFCLADTGQRGHWTLWGRPLQLLDSIADIVQVEV